VIGHYSLDLSSVWRYRELLVSGLLVSGAVGALALGLGLLGGLVVGLGRLSRRRALAWPAGFLIEVFRGTPPLVQLFWFYYCLPLLFDVRLSALTTAVLSLGLFSSAYVGEIVRGGIQSVHKGQVQAARALGLSQLQALREIVLPQAVRRMWPPLMSQAVDVLKATALASSITVPELMYQTYNATSQTFRFVEFYTVSALIYLAICLPLVWRLRRLEWRSGV
jgi:polar amino acid transport system permease protein